LSSRTPPYVFLAYAGTHESFSLTDLRFVKKVDSRFHGNDKKKSEGDVGKSEGDVGKSEGDKEKERG